MVCWIRSIFNLIVPLCSTLFCCLSGLFPFFEVSLWLFLIVVSVYLFVFLLLCLFICFIFACFLLLFMFICLSYCCVCLFVCLIVVSVYLLFVLSVYFGLVWRQKNEDNLISQSRLKMERSKKRFFLLLEIVRGIVLLNLQTPFSFSILIDFHFYLNIGNCINRTWMFPQTFTKTFF